jgi:hypothetical protein
MRERLWVLTILLLVLLSQVVIAVAVVDWRDGETINTSDVQAMIDDAQFGPPPTEDFPPLPD